MKRAIYPLYAPADEGRVKPILDALQQKGVTVRTKAPGKGDVLVLFLSENLPAEGPETDAFFRLNAGRELVIPVNLDGSTPPEELQSALMARHSLDGRKYGTAELADLIAKAVAGEKKSRLSLVLSLIGAAALLAVGGFIWWKQRPQPEPEPAVVEATATPEPTPTATPTPSPTPEPTFPDVDLAFEELQKVHELIIVGDSLTHFNGDEQWVAEAGWARVEPEYVANRSFENGEARWYSTEDGHELVLHDWGALDFLPYMKNLQMLTLVKVRGTLPDLSGLKKLSLVDLYDCEIDDISGLKGTLLGSFSFSGPVIDLSPLNDCTRLEHANLHFYGGETIDLSGFGPLKLRSLNLSGDGSERTADLSGLQGCPNLMEARLDGVPVTDLSCLSAAKSMYSLDLNDLQALTSLNGLQDHTGLTNLHIDNCFRLSDLEALSSCSFLQELSMEDCSVSDLSFLAGAKALKKLEVRNMGTLRSFYGLEEHKSLRWVSASGTQNLSDLSALSNCESLEGLNLYECFALRDISPVVTLPKLKDLQIYGSELSNVDFLWDIQNKEYFSFGIAEVPNWEGLAAIGKYSFLNITDRNGSALPYVENATVIDFELWNRGGRGNNSEGLDLTKLPSVTNELKLHCVTSLEGIDQPLVSRMILDDCPYLTTLKGMEGLPRLSNLAISNCPRLADWTGLYELEHLQAISLEALFTLPDFGKITANHVDLTTIYDLKDLSCFESYGQDRYQISLMDVDEVTDLSPLYHLHGEYLGVPAHLKDQAQALVDSGLLDEYEVTYPEGWWEPIVPHIELLSLSEVDTLPSALLSRVDRLTLAGDAVLPNEGAWVNEDWSTNPPALYVCYDGEEERYPVEPGTLTDLTCLKKLTGLRELTVYAQPQLTSLEGIQAMGDLKDLDVRQCPALTDGSAAFTVQSLEELRFWFTGVRSIQGVQNLYALRMLDLNDNPVDDLSPLEACGALEDVNFQLPMMTFEELKAQPEAVRRNIKNLTIAGAYVYDGGPWWFETDWVTDPPTLYLHSNETDERLPLQEGAVTDMAELAALLPGLERLDLYGQDLTTLDGVENFSRLRDINVNECRGITDFTALWRTASLENISLRNEPIDSIEGIEQLPHLVNLSLSGTNVRDISPLERLDYSFSMSEENDGRGFNLAADVMDANKLTYEDYAPLEAVPVYWNLNMNNVPVDRWIDHVMGKEMLELSCHRSGMTNEQLKAFVEAHPMLEQLDLRWNTQLTDLSCLLELKGLRQVFVSEDMQRAIRSLGEGHEFRLEIE